MKRVLKLVLSGAITGHEEEAKRYFDDAEKAVLARYPLAEVFNPMRLPRTRSWEDCMVVCRSRIQNWATGIVYIKNEHYELSKGTKEEKALGIDRCLYQFVYDGSTVEEISL